LEGNLPITVEKSAPEDDTSDSKGPSK